MEIRFYKEADFSEAVKIFVELSSYYLGENSSSETAVADNIKSNILGPDSGVKLILAFEGGTAIALATISIMYPAPKETGQLFIKELFISKNHQSHGIGKKVMGFIARFAQSKNCSRLDFTVDSDNQKAISFYQSLGLLPLDTKLYFRAKKNEINRLSANM